MNFTGIIKVRPCKSEELSDKISGCLLDEMVSEAGESHCITIPTKLAIGYSRQGKLGLSIGSSIITCDDFPPERDEVIRIIKEVYDSVFSMVSLQIKVGNIKVFHSETNKENCLFEIELHQLH